MTWAMFASAATLDAAGWLCIAQGACGLARICFAAAVPLIVCGVLGALR